MRRCPPWHPLSAIRCGTIVLSSGVRKFVAALRRYPSCGFQRFRGSGVPSAPAATRQISPLSPLPTLARANPWDPNLVWQPQDGDCGGVRRRGENPEPRQSLRQKGRLPPIWPTPGAGGCYFRCPKVNFHTRPGASPSVVTSCTNDAKTLATRVSPWISSGPSRRPRQRPRENRPQTPGATGLRGRGLAGERAVRSGG
jgi:hypothetical protein